MAQHVSEEQEFSYLHDGTISSRALLDTVHVVEELYSFVTKNMSRGSLLVLRLEIALRLKMAAISPVLVSDTISSR